MGAYFTKTPFWLKKIFPKGLIWDMPGEKDPTVHITFDDGPHPTATPYVLEQLAKYDAKATFFCVGNNVTKYPDIYKRLLQAGHVTANHTFDHVVGTRTATDNYLANIEKAKTYIESKLFRPPHGRITYAQVRKLQQKYPDWKIIMWDVLSADFDKEITGQQCRDNVLKNIRPGSIVLFHDSEKAWDRMSYALPYVLEYCRQQNWKMKVIPG